MVAEDEFSDRHWQGEAPWPRAPWINEDNLAPLLDNWLMRMTGDDGREADGHRIEVNAPRGRE